MGEGEGRADRGEDQVEGIGNQRSEIRDRKSKAGRIGSRQLWNFGWIVAGAFGLIHGAGFSSHLTELLKSMLDIENI